jgi:hypothetical protein
VRHDLLTHVRAFGGRHINFEMCLFNAFQVFKPSSGGDYDGNEDCILASEGKNVYFTHEFLDDYLCLSSNSRMSMKGYFNGKVSAWRNTAVLATCESCRLSSVQCVLPSSCTHSLLPLLSICCLS